MRVVSTRTPKIVSQELCHVFSLQSSGKLSCGWLPRLGRVRAWHVDLQSSLLAFRVQGLGFGVQSLGLMGFVVWRLLVCRVRVETVVKSSTQA